MRVATWNIQHGLDAARLRVDLRQTARVLSGLDASIVALQEVDVRSPRSGFAHQARRLARTLDARWVYSPAIRVGVVGTSGCALLVRGPIGDVVRLRLPAGADRTARSALVAGAMGLSVAVCHLAVDAPTALTQLQVVMAELAGRSGPCLLLGDLNLRTEAVRDALGSHGFSLADSAPTFPALAPAAAIDHIASRVVHVASVEAVQTQASDHLPLVAAVDIDDP